jgi:hypothetical protein
MEAWQAGSLDEVQCVVDGVAAGVVVDVVEQHHQPNRTYKFVDQARNGDL